LKISSPDILNVISDEKTLALLKTIASVNDNDSDTLRTKTKLTRKQFYSRISMLIPAGLIRRNKGEYFLTSLGKVIYYYRMRIESALEGYWKLKAIDSFEISSDLLLEERRKIVDNLIGDNDIKEILLENKWHYCSYSSSKIESRTQESELITQRHQEKSSLKIMLVEDEQDILLTYKTFLLTQGYNVDAFTDSYEALKHFINCNHPYYDLVIMDIRMSGLNGLQLYQRMKAIDDTFRVIFVSALDALQEMVSIFPDLDFTNIIRKPINQEEFIDKVKMALA
jgi:CheY-like chemotaxis protein